MLVEAFDICEVGNNQDTLQNTVHGINLRITQLVMPVSTLPLDINQETRTGHVVKRAFLSTWGKTSRIGKFSCVGQPQRNRYFPVLSVSI